ncbi:MAG TPA: TonB-dependent receptor [Sphingobacteriaceae bacterium]|nr:TonB-dependent receptor [Sphingobacteriaceae bacterium]
MDRAFLNIQIRHLLFIIFSLIFTPVYTPLFAQSNSQQHNRIQNIPNSDTLKNSQADRKVNIEEVSVTRQSAKREIERSGFAANVIETKQAALRNVQTNELLDRTVGVRVRQNGGLGAQVDYNLNGMSGRAVGIFIDGIEISTYGSSFNLSNIPPSMIERIEVYKGVLPAHLSGDLLGGAINVVLKKEAAQNTLSASVSYGSFNTLQSDLSGIFRNVKSGLTARGSLFYSYSDNDYEIWGKFARNTLPDGTMEHTRAKRFFDAYKTLGGRFELGFTDVAWADALMLGYNGSSTYNEIQHGQYMTQPYMGRFTQSEAHVLSLNYSKSHLLTEGLHLRLNGVYSDRDQYVQDTVSWNYNWSGEKMIGFHGVPIKTSSGAQQNAPTMNDINRKIVNIRSDLEYELNRSHSLRLNHVFYTVDRQDHDRIRHVAEQLYQSTSALSKNVTSLAYESQMFERRLRTNLFAKWYQQEIDRIDPYVQTIDGQNVYAENRTQDHRQTLGYGLAVSYSLSPRILLLSSAEKAVRMPAETEIFGGPEENIVANPNLKPEISNNLNFGFRLDILSLERHKVSMSGTGFARNIKDKIVRKAEDRLVNEAVEVMPFENLGLAQSIGFEGELNYAFADRLNAMLNFSKFNALFKKEFDPATGMRLERYNKQLPNEPFFTLNTSVHYRLYSIFQKSSILNLHYNFGYVDPFNTIWIKSNNTMTPRQFSQDLGASYLFPHRKLVLSLDVKNVFNAEIYDNFAVQKPGRALYLKLNYTINHF